MWGAGVTSVSKVQFPHFTKQARDNTSAVKLLHPMSIAVGLGLVLRGAREIPRAELKVTHPR